MAVFVTDSPADAETRTQVIARIGKAAYDFATQERTAEDRAKHAD